MYEYFSNLEVAPVPVDSGTLACKPVREHLQHCLPG